MAWNVFDMKFEWVQWMLRFCFVYYDFFFRLCVRWRRQCNGNTIFIRMCVCVFGWMTFFPIVINHNCFNFDRKKITSFWAISTHTQAQFLIKCTALFSMVFSAICLRRKNWIHRNSQYFVNKCLVYLFFLCGITEQTERIEPAKNQKKKQRRKMSDEEKLKLCLLRVLSTLADCLPLTNKYQTEFRFCLSITT